MLLIITFLLSSKQAFRKLNIYYVKPEACFWSNRIYLRMAKILIIKIPQISYRVSRRVNHHRHRLEDRRRRHLGHPVGEKNNMNLIL